MDDNQQSCLIQCKGDQEHFVGYDHEDVCPGIPEYMCDDVKQIRSLFIASIAYPLLYLFYLCCFTSSFFMLASRKYIYMKCAQFFWLICFFVCMCLLFSCASKISNLTYKDIRVDEGLKNICLLLGYSDLIMISITIQKNKIVRLILDKITTKCSRHKQIETKQRNNNKLIKITPAKSNNKTLHLFLLQTQVKQSIKLMLNQAQKIKLKKITLWQKLNNEYILYLFIYLFNYILILILQIKTSDQFPSNQIMSKHQSQSNQYTVNMQRNCFKQIRKSGLYIILSYNQKKQQQANSIYNYENQ
ncbi:hypothetical protein pb186bvf_007780 [Paramecium bursaria]